ncbi:hypothetical protein FQN54_004774 [Arachnomyces sp. PD_36]|nr:hypothetical protein FQN54_004774 [Arachnomyces sp. PD_36]
MPLYRIFLLEETGSPRNHVGIFLETSPPNTTTIDTTPIGSGTYFNVAGTILTGMTYSTHPLPANPPTSLPTFHAIHYIGLVSSSTPESAVESIDAVCRSVEVPGAQLNLDGSRKNETVPVRKCREWTGEVGEKLFEAGVVRGDGEVSCSVGLALGLV